MAKNMNPTKVITGKDTRWSYCNVWDAKSINGGTPKYSVSLIIPKADTVTVQKIRAAIEAAYRDGESKLRGNGKTVPPLCQRQLGHRTRRGRCCLQSHSDPQRGVLRRVWPRQHQLLRVQLQRESRYCLRAQQPAENPRR